MASQLSFRSHSFMPIYCVDPIFLEGDTLKDDPVSFLIYLLWSSVTSNIWLFVTPRTTACQASLSLTIAQSLVKLMSIESVMPSNLCRPLLLLPAIFPSMSLFQWVRSLHHVAKVLELQLQHQSIQWIFRVDFFRNDWLDHLPCGSAGKESACNGGDLDSIPGLERSPWEGKGYPLQYSGLENSMDCIVYGVAKNQTWLLLSKGLSRVFSNTTVWKH